MNVYLEDLFIKTPLQIVMEKFDLNSSYHEKMEELQRHNLKLLKEIDVLERKMYTLSNVKNVNFIRNKINYLKEIINNNDKKYNQISDNIIKNIKKYE